jgi:hypothetical protein
MDNTTAYLATFIAAALFGVLGFLLGRHNRPHTLDIQLDDSNVEMAIEKALTAAGIGPDTKPDGGYLNSAGFPIDPDASCLKRGDECRHTPKDISLFTDSIEVPVEDSVSHRCVTCKKDMDTQVNEWLVGEVGAKIWRGAEGLYCCLSCRSVTDISLTDPLDPYDPNFNHGQPDCDICCGSGVVNTLEAKHRCPCTAQVKALLPIAAHPAFSWPSGFGARLKQMAGQRSERMYPEVKAVFHGSSPLSGKPVGRWTRRYLEAQAQDFIAAQIQAQQAEPEKYGHQGQPENDQ